MIRRRARNLDGHQKSQATEVEWFGFFISGLAQKGVKTRTRARVVDSSFPTRIILASEKETGEIGHLLPFFGRQGFAKFGDLGGAHGF